METTNISKIIQNLKDAGCSDKLIADFIEKTGKEKQQLSLLSEHRKTLLKSLHTSQKKIDCLDFLIYNMKKNS